MIFGEGLVHFLRCVQNVVDFSIGQAVEAEAGPMKRDTSVGLDQVPAFLSFHLDQDVTREKLAAGDALLAAAHFRNLFRGDNDFPQIALMGWWQCAL